MLSAILIYALIALFCFPVVLYLISNAPKGWEDEKGFHKEEEHLAEASHISLYHINKSA
jgi:hypothetical protein